jgi:DNA-binding response OmpR family regulator
MSARILWIEGKRSDEPAFIPALRRKGYLVELVSTGSEALTFLSRRTADLIVLYAASMRRSGKQICRSLSEQANGLPILVISSHEHPEAEYQCANTVLILPFTPRKLLNRIVPLLPVESGNLLYAGPIRLDLETKHLRCEGRETRLTPRLVQLLSVFLKRPGEVLEREALFKQVWNTQYTEDTRTLDVHISWLRLALEENPRKPKYLKTVRGVGYRLDTD